MNRVGIVCATSALMFAACRKPPEEIVLAIVGGVSGVSEPCGCTSKPLGGLDRLAGVVERMRAQSAHVALLVAGDTLVRGAETSPALAQQEQREGTAIARIIQHLRPDAVLLGPRDDAQQWAASAFTETSVPVLLALQPGSGSETDNVVLDFSGFKVGVMGMPDRATDKVRKLSQTAQMLHAHGCGAVIALVATFDEGLALAAAVEGVNVVVAAGAAEAFEPQVVGTTLVVAPMNEGRGLGVLRLSPRRPHQGWVYDDEGRSTRVALEKRIAALREQLLSLEDGPARQARADKLRAIESERAAFTTQVPQASLVRWSEEELGKQVAPAAWATAILKDYNASLCRLVNAATDELVCPTTDERDQYLGTEGCRGCHTQAFTLYDQSKHAHAWGTLVREGKQCSLTCIGCHTVGYDEPGGFCRLRDAEAHANVGCESCHGPALLHSKNPYQRPLWSSRFSRTADASVCVRCHNPTHSDRFSYQAYLSKILGPGHGHPVPSE